MTWFWTFDGKTWFDAIGWANSLGIWRFGLFSYGDIDVYVADIFIYIYFKFFFDKTKIILIWKEWYFFVSY